MNLQKRTNDCIPWKKPFFVLFWDVFPGGDVLNNWYRIIFESAIYSFENGFGFAMRQHINIDLTIDESVGVAGPGSVWWS